MFKPRAHSNAGALVDDVTLRSPWMRRSTTTSGVKCEKRSLHNACTQLGRFDATMPFKKTDQCTLLGLSMCARQIDTASFLYVPATAGRNQHEHHMQAEVQPTPSQDQLSTEQSPSEYRRWWSAPVREAEASARQGILESIHTTLSADITHATNCIEGSKHYYCVGSRTPALLAQEGAGR